MLATGTGSSVDSLLPGFRSAIYASVVKPIPMKLVKDNLRIQMPENSNRVRVLCTDASFKGLVVCNDFSMQSIGVTLYIPGEYSVLILGLDWETNYWKGIATHKTVLPYEVEVPSKQAFLMRMNTEAFTKGVVSLFDKSPHLDPNGTYGCNKNPPKSCNVVTPNSITFEDHNNDWEIGDGGCHFEMTLGSNSYLKSSGGKIDLDLQDSVSFQVTLQPLTSVGKIMLYRPLLIVTQSNPEVLRISSKFARLPDRQVLSVLLKPTGVKQGVSSFVVRSQISSISCDSPSSFTFIVQCVRTRGRRLVIKYPKKVEAEEILKAGRAVENEIGEEIYTVLKTNYRPPSVQGKDIPLTKNVYNADPSKPLYKSWYKKSEQKAEFKQCYMQSSRYYCGCTPADKLSDDPAYSDCKEKVYVAKRDEFITMDISYPPRMPDSEQLQDFFSPTPKISIFVEEINGRTDYKIDDSSFITSINNDEVINMGERFYFGENLMIKLQGTGLYHFKAELGRFHSFNDVTGYFILYSETNHLDDVLLVMIVMLTMTVCFILVFFGFIRVRHRLVAHLPIRVEPLKPKLA
ncbi:unnamed protein product [Allacma fusca]|uniref:Cation channel sperm-associated protein subunit beta C-terminal domain-containing protein n=1 Tax=Allacma fusca TaxID=39272 RepID=A0A8J2P287_9HEXA|nr:unnamed protein product [Allacma fusca]